MSDLFKSVMNGNITRNDITNDTVMESVYNDDVFMEAMYPQHMVHLKTFPKVYILPKGNPTGKGNICFLYTPNFNSSIDIINTNGNFKNGGKYYYYFYNMMYSGLISGRRYRIRDFDRRKDLYKEITDKTRLKPYPKLLIGTKFDKRNLYFDMHKYIEIFTTISKKFTLMKKVKAYWTFFKSIYNNDSFNSYDKKFVLINADQWKLEKDIKSNLYNPVFMLYFTLFRSFDIIDDLDIDFYIFTKDKSLKINPSRCDKKSYLTFKVEMKKLYMSVTKIDSILSEEEIQKDETEETVTSDVISILSPIEQKQFFTGKEELNKSSIKNTTKQDIKKDDKNDVEERIKATVKKVSKKVIGNGVVDDDVKPIIHTAMKIEAEKAINDDKELLKDIYKQNQSTKITSTPASSARDRQLKEEQLKLKVNGLTVKQLKEKKVSNIQIPVTQLSPNVVKTTNENMKTIKFNNFEKVYNEEVMSKDITNSILALNDKSIPMYVRNIDIKDTSDELNYRDTYTIYLEDVNRQRHTVKVDIPKFIDDKFLYIGGNKKLIKKQNFLLPVIKCGPDEVQVVTNYNKMFIRRVDTKSMSSVSRLSKLFKTDAINLMNYFKAGTAIKNNIDYITTLEYDELSKIFIQFNCDKCLIMFSQVDCDEYMREHKIDKKDGQLFIGTDKNGTPIFIDYNTQVDENQRSIVDIIMEALPEDVQNKYHKIAGTKRLMYAEVTVMSQAIPIMMLICFWEGLTKVMKKLNVKFELSDKKPSVVKSNQNVIRFSDCYMIYEENIPISLMMNGLRIIDTTKYAITDMDDQEVYIEYFTKVYGKASISNALMNYYEFLIDPITREVLEDINLPTELVELIIHATSLLSDSQSESELNEKMYRIRSNEIIPAILYEALAKNYVNYRNSNGRKKFTVPQDIVIKNLLALKTVEDYSTLNPVLELESTHAVSNKGFRGVNLDQAYTVPKRSYHKSMIGIIGPATSPDGNVGVNKTLSLEPTITSPRGYTDVRSDKLKELKDVNLFSPGELLIPLGAMYDDPTRLGHAIRQSRHVIPVKKSSPVLISNGAEEVCRHHLSSDFVVNAKEDGKVIQLDDDTKILIVQYKSGKTQAVNLGGNIVKNAGGGFYLSNVLKTNLKLGDSFKKDSVIAYHKDFFKNSKFNNCRMNVGTLSKVAIMSTYNTYEDATFITEKLSQAASTEMCFLKQIVIGKNSNVHYIAKKDDEIDVGDTLVQFDTSYDDSELNNLLSNLSELDKSRVLEDSKNSIKSKYSGKIIDIKMYSTVPLSDLSPSLRKIFEKYYSGIRKRNRLLEEADPESKNSVVKCGILCSEPTKEVTPNKFGNVKGQRAVDSVLIEFYIQHSEPLEVGSKIANYTALKNTIGEIIPNGYEPYSEFRPDEEISSIIAANSILKRMTPSIVLTAFGNKLIIELKRKLEDIYNKK